MTSQGDRVGHESETGDMYYSSPFTNVRHIHRSAFIHNIRPNRSYDIYSFYTSVHKCMLSTGNCIVIYDKMPEAVMKNKVFL